MVGNHLVKELGQYDKLETQRTFGNTRVDFVLTYADGSKLLLEVKNVVCADYPTTYKPHESRPKSGIYYNEQMPYRRTAIFPHGAAKAKIGVVSDRAIKHVHELTTLHQGGKLPDGTPVKCAVLFIVNRSVHTSMYKAELFAEI